MKTFTSLTLLLTFLTMVVEGNSPSKGQLKSSETAKSRGRLTQPVLMIQRGRKKSIWSYKPGHRSLAFLVAGEVDVVSPPPVTPGTGDYRCLGCCGDKEMILGKSTAAPKISNRVSRVLAPPAGPRNPGTEPNSINDRCLGCCEESVTPSLRVTAVTEVRSIDRRTGSLLDRKTTTGSQSGATAGEQRAAQRPHHLPCTSPRCNPDWRYESSSSSEEVPLFRRQGPRSRLQPLRFRTGSRCRHLGCRSALGSAEDSSSSSEED
ncbi:uncharacterized protein LOC122938318 isoform X2 [Bufo gargarizans]|uniref:uncharacterized protein LOC122938318 isoform X2 n=1 Tax=Bufo gargarizans TaxID=30331 RepID=UPI001CF4781D|nr:uncharacterized protein LOC122938318 isoform X2 [Bufo gargarizans]XP_044149684.1 uncharacterized protein LOC122938318 isoform X2 [Bufo gargarizans]